MEWWGWVIVVVVLAACAWLWNHYSLYARLDRGTLGVVAVTVHSARQAAGLLRGRHTAGLRTLAAQEVTVTADAQQLPVGIDGEAVFLPVPVRCAVRPGALRVWVPRDRPGVPPELDWARLRQLAGRDNGPAPVAAPEAGSTPPRVLRQDSA